MAETAQIDLRKEYLQQRLSALGITDDENIIELYNPDAEHPMNPRYTKPVFTHDQNGNINILVYSLDAEPIIYTKAGKGKMSELNGKEVHYHITRLKEPITNKQGDTVKYLLPKNQPTYPFFPPALVKAFEQKTQIKNLVLTEGYFKAFKACKHGIMCVGLPSITCMKNRETGELHQDIKRLIETCKVERIIWLTDGDCLDITTKLNEETDLYKRPLHFFRSVQTFFELLSKFDKQTKYFAHINSENIDGLPKGLDDLLCAHPDKETEIVNELFKFDSIKGGKYVGNYFVRFNLDMVSMGAIRKYFMLDDVNTFYMHHSGKHKQLGDREFIFNGTRYKYNHDLNECAIIAPGEAKQYFMVGDDFYKFIMVPNKYGIEERTYVKRSPATIKLTQKLFAKKNEQEFFVHIPKYEAFCCVPDHVNYQQVIRGCFNAYALFEHEPEEGDFSVTLDFVKHIFGENEITYKRKSTGEVVKLKNYELGLDYLQLLYTKPQQILPILCLVSAERQTGKTTFSKWEKMIFTQNMAIVGNADLKGDFNAHWANKLIVCCDETKIDKFEVVEKIKSLSTSDRIMMNAKSKQQVEMEFFAKFQLISNNEENFIYTDGEEIRFWVIKVPSITKRNVDLLSDLQEEIPAFLNFLNKRQMATDYEERHWFNSALLKTDALKKIVAHSKQTIEKELRVWLRDMFFDFGQPEIRLDMKSIKEKFPRYENNYIEKVLEQDFHLTREPTARSTHYRWETIKKNTDTDNPTIEQVRIEVKTHGRHFVFKREDFLSEAEILAVQDLTTRTNELPLTNQTNNNGHNATTLSTETDGLPF